MPLPPTRHDWPRLPGELVVQLDTGRIYNRDLDELFVALAATDVAVTRRMFIRSRNAAHALTMRRGVTSTVARG